MKVPVLLLFVVLLTTIAVHSQQQDTSIAKDNMYMYNYIAEEFEVVDVGSIIDFEPYIPQLPEALNLYRLYLKMDYTPLEACYKVLKFIIDSSGDATTNNKDI